MPTLLWIIFATLLVSLISLVGIITLSVSAKKLKSILGILLGLSAGTLMGGAFLHLLPDALDSLEADTVFMIALVGFITFFVLEKLIWRHCHDQECEIHTFAYLNLVGDGVHNFIDGLIIAASFLVDIQLGFVTTLVVIFHEIPQEIGDFGVLIYGGIKVRKVIFYNFMTALAAVIGGILGYFLLPQFEGLTDYVLPFAAGGFLYIAAADLIPELHKEENRKKSTLAFSFFIFGIFLMWAFKFI